MRSLLTADDVYAHIILLRGSDKRTLLILESDADCASLDPHVDPETCETIPGNGKASVLGALEIVNSRGPARVLGIVDADLDTHLGLASVPSNVVTTDLYDLEATIFFAPGLADRLCAAHFDREALRAHTAAAGTPVPELVTRLTFPLGVLRLISRQDGLDLSLRDFPVSEVLESDCAGIDLAALVNLAVRRSKSAAASEGELLRRLLKELAATPETRDVCCGHDIVSVLSALGRQRFASRTGAVQMHKSLRAALDCASLGATRLYSDVARWAASHSTKIWAC
jgi:hypothetical protein